MLIDCDTCCAQGVHCHDCVISVLLAAPPLETHRTPVELDPAEQIAFVSLAAAGLIPPLRLVAGGRVEDPSSDTRGIA